MCGELESMAQNLVPILNPISGQAQRIETSALGK